MALGVGKVCPLGWNCIPLELRAFDITAGDKEGGGTRVPIHIAPLWGAIVSSGVVKVGLWGAIVSSGVVLYGVVKVWRWGCDCILWGAIVRGAIFFYYLCGIKQWGAL